MIVRVITSLVFAAITVPCAILGGWFMLGLSLILVGIGTYEVLSMPGKKRFNPAVWVITYLAVYGLVYWQFIAGVDSVEQMFSGNLFGVERFAVSAIGLFVYLLALFIVWFFSKDFRLEDLFYLFLTVALVSLGFYAVIYLRFFPAGLGYPEIWGGFSYDLTTCLLVWWVLFGVWTSDIGAYFVGVLFGKHPMNARISPHKTWEGFAGGLAFSLIFSAVYVSIVSYACHAPIVRGIIDPCVDPSDWGWVALLAVLFPLLDNVGGFIFSGLKRHYQAKDWGRVLPGHGGIIDRFDAVLVTSIAASIIVTLLSGGTAAVV